MNYQLVSKLDNGLEIHKISAHHGTPRYRVKNGKIWVGKTSDGGYISARAAKRYANNFTKV